MKNQTNSNDAQKADYDQRVKKFQKFLIGIPLTHPDYLKAIAARLEIEANARNNRFSSPASIAAASVAKQAVAALRQAASSREAADHFDQEENEKVLANS